MLVLEIAAGVLIGLLLYRGLESYCKNRDLTMPAGIFAIFGPILTPGLLITTLVVFGFYVYQTVHRREWMKVQGSDGGIYEIRRYRLPSDPPGYLYVRATQRITEDHPQAPLLRGGHW